MASDLKFCLLPATTSECHKQQCGVQEQQWLLAHATVRRISEVRVQALTRSGPREGREIKPGWVWEFKGVNTLNSLEGKRNERKEQCFLSLLQHKQVPLKSKSEVKRWPILK